MNSFFTLAVTTTQDKKLTEMTDEMQGLMEGIITMGFKLLIPAIIIAFIVVVANSLEQSDERLRKSLEKKKSKEDEDNDLDTRTRIAKEESSVDYQRRVESWDKMVEGLHASQELKSQPQSDLDSQPVEDVQANRSVEEKVLDNIIKSDVATTEMKERAEKLLPHFLTPTEEEIQLQNEQDAIELDLVTLERIVEARVHLDELISPPK